MVKKQTKKASKSKKTTKALTPAVRNVRKVRLNAHNRYTADGFYDGNEFTKWDSPKGLEKRKFRSYKDYELGIPAHNSTAHGRKIDNYMYALPAGYKVSERTGKWYNEYRENRTDSHQEHHDAYNNNMPASRKNKTYKNVYISDERILGKNKELKAVRFTIGYTDYLNRRNHTLRRAVNRYYPEKEGYENLQTKYYHGVPSLGLWHEKPKYTKTAKKYAKATGYHTPEQEMNISRTKIFPYENPFDTPVKYTTKKAPAKKAPAKKATTKKAPAKKTSARKGTKQSRLL